VTSDHPRRPADDRRIQPRQALRIFLWLALLGILLAFALLNTDDTHVDWIIREDDAPLFVVIAASAAVGFIMGAIAMARWRRRS